MPTHDVADFDNLGLVDRRREQKLASHERPAVAGRSRRFDVNILLDLAFYLHGRPFQPRVDLQILQKAYNIGDAEFIQS